MYAARMHVMQLDGFKHNELGMSLSFWSEQHKMYGPLN